MVLLNGCLSYERSNGGSALIDESSRQDWGPPEEDDGYFTNNCGRSVQCAFCVSDGRGCGAVTLPAGASSNGGELLGIWDCDHCSRFRVGAASRRQSSARSRQSRIG